MDFQDTLVIGSVFSSSALITGWARHRAIHNHRLDYPNHRSSHSVPTPTGGGMAIVVTFLLALIYFAVFSNLKTSIFTAFMGGGVLVAVIGYLDDLRDIPVSVRLPGHFLAAIWATVWLGGVPTLDLGFAALNLGWFGYIISVLGLVWLLNLYNFMDGIDGLSASEAVFVAGFGGILLLADGVDAVGWSALALAAAAAGFLFWNWPKAKIFMGDVGSGFLGYVFGIFVITCADQPGVSMWVWLLLLSVFIVDATITLLRRLTRGEKVYEAHRSHAYQHAATLLNSHLRVTLGIIGINVAFVTPLALLAWQFPDWVIPITFVAFFALAITALRLHAGIGGIKKPG